MIDTMADTRPHKDVLGFLTAKLHATADNEGVDRKLAEQYIEYLYVSHGIVRVLVDAVVDATLAAAKATTIIDSCAAVKAIVEKRVLSIIQLPNS